MLNWGPKGLERTKELVKVFINHEFYPDDKLQASWEPGPDDSHHLKVSSTTKKSLAELLNDNQPLYETKALSSAKNHVQNSLKQLEKLQLLEDKRKCKNGPYSEKLKLTLKFPSRITGEILDCLKTEWDRFLDDARGYNTGDYSYDITISYKDIKIKIQVGDNADSETVKTLLGTFLKQQELNPNSRSQFDQARSKTVGSEPASMAEDKQLLGLAELLQSENFNFQFRAAAQLSEFQPTPDVIQLLENSLEAVPTETTAPDAIALSWQLALSLGKLDPTHAQAAVAQNLQIELPDDLDVELLLATRIREDGDMDILVQLYPSLEPYLPEGILVEILDELDQKISFDLGETFLEFTTQPEDMERVLTFYAAPEEDLTIQISYLNQTSCFSFCPQLYDS
jgi:hypothetical protein